MARYRQEPAYTHGNARRSAVVLANLGTPAAPTAEPCAPTSSSSCGTRGWWRFPGPPGG